MPEGSLTLRDLPKVDALAASPGLASYASKLRTIAARTAIERARALLLNGVELGFDLGDWAATEANRLSVPAMKRVINASGVVLHTGLGRARLAPSAADHVAEVAANHALVEFDEETGKRGDRQAHVRELLKALTGAEDAFVVNNNAAAVFLTLTALAKRKEVILSRGEMVEIGGSFRMPDIVRQSGCRLVEVGCTNKTHLADFENAITLGTGAILRCHPSNFRIVGFTESPSVTDLVGLGPILIDDVGSGCLLDTNRFGLPREPVLGESLRMGAGVELASGDKLLGATQAGIIVGRADLVQRIRKHPLARAVRIDKLSLAGLGATLQLYLAGRELEIPTWKYLARTLDELRPFADRLASALGGTVAEGITETGGGSLPGHGVKTWRVALPAGKADRQLGALRSLSVPVIGRIEAGRAWLDPRTMEVDEVEMLVSAAHLVG